MKTAMIALALVLAASGTARAQCLVKFRPAASYLPGGDRIVVGDINGDGMRDVVVNSSDPARSTALLGSGDGSLQSLPTMNGDSASSMALADLNGDGHLDLVMGSWGSVLVRLGDGDGTFQPTVFYVVGAAGGGPGAVTVGDFNGDGWVDVAIADNYRNNVSVLRGNGNGTLQPAVSYPAGTSPVSMTSVDVNGDGVLDFVVGLNLGISVLKGNGDGTFKTPMVTSIPSSTGYVRAVAVADFNGDHLLHVAAVTQNGELLILLGNGNGTFQQPRETSFGSVFYFTSVVAADFNNDGKADLAIGTSSTFYGGMVLILQGDGSGGFMNRGGIGITNGVASLAVADLRGIGKPDILATSHSAFGGVSVLLNASGAADFDGDGSPGTDADIAAYFACLAGNCCSSCASADFNGDGDTGTDQDIDAFFRVLSGGAC